MSRKKLITLLIAISLVISLISALAYFWLFIPDKENFLVETAQKAKTKMSDCESNANPIFTHDITNLTKIDYIVPPGNVEDYGDYQVFKTHSYMKGPNKVPVYAPIDSILYQGIYINEGGINQYGLFFEVSCEVFYIFDHVVEVPDKIAAVFPDTPAEDTSEMGSVKEVEIKAGELVGYSIGAKFEQWDFGIYNSTKKREHNDVDAPVHYRDQIADCPYDYFPTEKKDIYYSMFDSHLSGVPTPTRFCQF